MRTRKDVDKALEFAKRFISTKVGFFELAKLLGISERQLFLVMEANKEHFTLNGTNGGIDLSVSKNMRTFIKDGNGVEMNIDPAMIAKIKEDGVDSLSPFIFSVTPLTSIWPLSGLKRPLQ